MCTTYTVNGLDAQQCEDPKGRLIVTPRDLRHRWDQSLTGGMRFRLLDWRDKTCYRCGCCLAERQSADPSRDQSAQIP